MPWPSSSPIRAVLATGCLFACAACSSEPSASGLPVALPFEVTRADRGDPVTAEEVTAFTRRLTGLWASKRYFEWARSISHGVDASTGKPDFALWWHDVEAVKQGDEITFRHASSGGGHNVYIPTSELLTAAASAYLSTGDAGAAVLTEQYAKGIAAACAGLIFDASDPNRYLMARNFVAQNHRYSLADGRKAAVDFSPWYSSYESWNAQRLHYPNNPAWGDIWVTNMRSKDDVPHIYLADAVLRYVLERSPDAAVKDAAARGDECVRGFAKDVVDSGYRIRTKDTSGQPWIPDEDLASFVTYESLIPNAECTAKLTSALISDGDPRGNDCSRADGNDYESFATSVHYYNYHIQLSFHLAAIWHALISGRNELALAMVNGLVGRAERYANPSSGEPGFTDRRWPADQAVFLLQAAASGLPLTSAEVRSIHQAYDEALTTYGRWERWDLWSSAVPDGTYLPGDYLLDDLGRLISGEQLAAAALYCFSPFKNPAGRAPVDCDIVGDRSRWAE